MVWKRAQSSRVVRRKLLASLEFLNRSTLTVNAFWIQARSAACQRVSTPLAVPISSTSAGRAANNPTVTTPASWLRSRSSA